MSLADTISILALSLLFEAFFSGSEIALISADKVGLKTLGEQRRSRMILRFLDDPGQLISTSLVGTNLCVVLSTVIATLSLIPKFPNYAEIISLAIMTPMVLVFGEIIPKSLFQHYADRLAPRLIQILSVFRIVFLPVVVLGSQFSAMLLRMFGVRESRGFISRDELRLLIDLPSRKGVDRITGDEKEMIARIFEFSDMTVEEVMLPLSEVTALPVDVTMEDLAREISDKAHTRIPLYRDRIDQIEGIVHAFDVLRAEGFIDVKTLARQPIFVPESQHAVDTLMRLQREGQGMAIVVDEYGGATGVITIEDIIEEVVGEIQDEHDETEELFKVAKDGSLLVKGKANVEAINRHAQIGIPESEEYETVAGYVLEEAKRIPNEGYQLKSDLYTITVERVSDRAIEELKILLKSKRGRTTEKNDKNP